METKLTIKRWNPSQTYTKQEEFLVGRLRRTRKLFAFLREHRHELFDEAMQVDLESMYRDGCGGKEPVCPAMMAMAALLQGYLGVSDAEAVELTVVDLRWQMVLGCLGSTEPAFSQGAFQAFRQRMIAHDMDRRLLERAVVFARSSTGFDYKKLPKALRVGMDSSPLEGAGRVEDTVNLLAHAGRKIVDCVAALLEWKSERVCREAGIPLLAESSVKKALDYTWSDPADKADAVSLLIKQLTSLESWIQKKMPEDLTGPPLKEHVETLHQIMGQDLEPDPQGGGVRVKDGVAPDRRVSIEDKEMRHGRKSKSKRFNGYKRHIALDLDTGLIVACAITLANRPEQDAASELEKDLAYLETPIGKLYIDRGYINAPVVDKVIDGGGEIICRPWRGRNGKLFPKSRFDINVRDKLITCPAGKTEQIQFGTTVEFDPDVCDQCPQRKQCTGASRGHGRTVAIAENEALQKRLRKLQDTPRGRARLRERVPVEHSLAHAGGRQGRRARYIGARKNLHDWRRAATITDLEVMQRNYAIREEELARAA